MAFGYYTAQAYSYLGRTVATQHRDFLVRNIVVTRCGCGSCPECTGAGSEVAARNRRRSNVPCVPWPTYEQVAQWAHSEGVESGFGVDATQNSAALQSAVMAAIDDISEDTGLPYYEVDDDGQVVFYDADGAVTTEEAGGEARVAEIPPKVELATKLHATRLYRRRLSPDGTLGSSAFGGAIRVSKYDPDVKNLLANHLRVGIA